MYVHIQAYPSDLAWLLDEVIECPTLYNIYIYTSLCPKRFCKNE